MGKENQYNLLYQIVCYFYFILEQEQLFSRFIVLVSLVSSCSGELRQLVPVFTQIHCSQSPNKQRVEKKEDYLSQVCSFLVGDEET